MTTLFHPFAEALAIEVPDDVVADYVEQGWRKSDPAKSTSSKKSADADAPK